MNSRAFTLFELLIVVVIIGLLMMIAMPNYVKARNDATRSLCISNQKMIYTAASLYTTVESDSLEEMSDRERLDALVDKGYLRGIAWTECPASKDNDYDDYTLIFKGGLVSDVDCDERGTQHAWP